MRRPKIGEDVIVRWLDSGYGETCKPKAVHALHIKETHGKVYSLGPDERLRGKVLKGMDITVLNLNMCSSGDKDSGSDMASIWWPSVVSVRVYPKKK